MVRKTVLITGGAKRIGATITRHFASKKYTVIINYLHSEKEALMLAKSINETGTTAIPYKADVTNCSEIQALFEFANKELGGVNILVNNAGVFPPKRKLTQLEFTDYITTLNINMHAPMITIKEFIRNDITDGRIINIASIGGIDIFKNCIDYNVSKAGLIRLTQVLAKELAPNVSVNCICPGIVKIDNEDINFSLDKIPMGRFATTNDIIAVVEFFSNGPNYITGQVISVAGGMEL